MKKLLVGIAVSAIALVSCNSEIRLFSPERFNDQVDGKEVSLYTLKNGSVTLQVTNFGARVVSLFTPDRDGKYTSIVVGHDNLKDYLTPPGERFLGACVGPVANRIGNASFTVDGEVCNTPVNDNGKNTLHGGRGYHLRPWTLEKTERGAALRLFDPDGEEGFPGNMSVRVDVALTDDGELILDYTASTDADTVVNLTNHSYFNLSGADTILDQELYLNADSYLEVDGGLIPTGEYIDVGGTDFDFRKRRPIASGKYDHCFVLKPDGIQAEAWDPASGRGFRMFTDQPGVQLYCGGGLGGVRGKNGRVYQPFAGFCLETQHFPDSPNHPAFPGTVLRAGETFHSRTRFAFFID